MIGADIKDHEVVIFDFSGATYLDDSAAMLIEQLMEVARKEQTSLIVMGLSGSAAHTLNVLQSVPEDQIVETVEEAREAAVALLGVGQDTSPSA